MSLRSLWAEFKAFAFKGNMIELAVALVIGAAFTTVVTSLVGDVIMPAVAYSIQTAKTAAVAAKEGVETVAAKTGVLTTQPTTKPATGPAGLSTTAPAVAAEVPPPAPPAPPAPAPKPVETALKPINFDDWQFHGIFYGKFIGSLLNFMIVAFAIFVVVVKIMGSVMKKMSKPTAPGEPTTKECGECLSIIPVKARRCAHCTALLTPPEPAV